MIVFVFVYILKGLYLPFKKMVPKLPGAKYVNNKIENIKDSTNQRIQSAKDTAYRSGILLLCIGIIIWLAIFMYVVFYYTYIPPLTHTRPVHLQFKTCDDAQSSICSFPTAHVQLTKRQQLLMVGQSYKIYLTFEMPESEANKNLGMFMACLELNDKDGALVANSCRPVMLHYRSWLFHMIKTVVYSPFLLLGTSEETQQIVVEMFSDFEEDQTRPITDVYIEIQTKKIELYSSTMQIQAHFTGLRYLMFHWPILSAIVGIGFNLLLIIFVLLLSWYHLFYSEGGAYQYTKNIRERLSTKIAETEKNLKKQKEGILSLNESKSLDDSQDCEDLKKL